MKRVEHKLKIGALALLVGTAAFTVGCSHSMGSSSSNGNNSNPNYNGNLVASTTGASSPTQTVLQGTGGAQAIITLTNKSALDQYTGWITNTPSDERVGVNLVKLATLKTGDIEFGGAVSIAFTDNGNTYIDTFSSHLQGGPNTIGSDVENNQYNLVSTSYSGLTNPSGQPYAPGYHGFFEGTTYCDGVPMAPGQYCPGQMFGGAVVLVIDQMQFSADGEGAGMGSGSVWFYNYQAGYGTGPIPGTSCWFITDGPYQCGSFFNNTSSINTLSSLNPTPTHLGNGSYITYTELGTFTGLNLGAAFNGQLQ